MMFRAENIGLSWKEQRDLDWQQRQEKTKCQDQFKREYVKQENQEMTEKRRNAEELQARKDDDLKDLGW